MTLVSWAITRGGTVDVHQGLHTPIIDQDTWDRAQAVSTTIKRNTPVVWTHTHLLRGKIRSFEGYAMSPASVPKKKVHADGVVTIRRVRYYCSQKGIRQGYKNCPIKTINAQHMDDLIRAVVLDHLYGQHGIDLRRLDAPSRDHWVRAAIHLVTLAPDALTLEIDHSHIDACRGAASGATPDVVARNALIAAELATSDQPSGIIPTCLFKPELGERDGRVMLTLHIKIKRHDNRRVLVAPDGRDLYLSFTPGGEPVPQPHLVRAIGQAFAWQRDVTVKGLSMEAVAKAANITAARVIHLLHLTRLSPAIISAVLSGRIGSSVSLRDLHAAADHLDWSLQAAALMLDG